MERLNFTGGAWMAKSPIANLQRCINYYPEENDASAPVPITLYQRPGLVPVVQGPRAPVRLIYQASNEQVYTVIGSTLYHLTAGWNLETLGELSEGRTAPCSATDNGEYTVFVDGSRKSWLVRLRDNKFSAYTDPTGAFMGADRLDTLDTYMVWNRPGTTEFGSSLSGGIRDNSGRIPSNLFFDGLYYAEKTCWYDKLETLIVARRLLYLFGKQKSEIWYNAGTTTFPFAECPGVYIEHGIAAKWSVARGGTSVFWLATDRESGLVVLRQDGYSTAKISNFAVDWAIAKMAKKGTIADATGYCYTQAGHLFYVLSFPTGDETWVYDTTISDPNKAWHQRAWTDANGALHRERANVFGNAYGVPLVGDWENGALYRMDPECFTDTVDGVSRPITCVRGFPHLATGHNAQGFPTPSNGLNVQHVNLWLDVETGTDPTQDVTGDFTLKYSNDRGRTWAGQASRNSGTFGNFLYIPMFEKMGIARDRVYELWHAIPGPVALNGAWYLAQIGEQEKSRGVFS
jgi:hypothetical protein